MRKILVNGAKGKMGKIVAACAKECGLEVIGRDSGDSFPPGNVDVIIDFSDPSVSLGIAEFAALRSTPLVMGTTGQSQSVIERLKDYARSVPMVKATNFSAGVNVIFWATRKIAELLGDGFDLELVEMHHRLKKDAPSGTALTLAKILAGVRRARLDDVVRNGRVGVIGERTRGEIGVHSIRGGDVFGDHTVIFAGDGERVELAHKASSRECFAKGALLAARWIIGKPPGLYNMQHVLGLEQYSVPHALVPAPESRTGIHV